MNDESKPNDLFGRILHRLDNYLVHVENALNLIAGVLIGALMVFGVMQIVLRTVFNSPIFGYIDIVEVTMVGFAVLSISFVQRVGGHVRMELFVARLKGRLLWLVESFGSLVAIFIVAVLIPYSYLHFQRAFQIGDSTIDIELVTWPAKLVVPFALSVLLLRLILQYLGYLRMAVTPSLDPIAIPLLKDVREQARDEIALASQPNPPAT